ncbi:MAG: hypothetical protein ACI33S_03875 [Bacilli bacterium]
MNENRYKINQVIKFEELKKNSENELVAKQIVSAFSAIISTISTFYAVLCNVPQALFWTGLFGLISYSNIRKSKYFQNKVDFYSSQIDNLEKDIYYYKK